MSEKENKTEREEIVFRSMKLADAEKMLGWGESSDLRYEHYTFTDYTLNDMRNWYFIKQKMLTRKVFGLFVSEVPVGFITLKKINFIENTAEIGLAIDPRVQGRGYGEIMVQKLLEHVYSNFPITCIFLDVAEFNTKARRLYEKLGFMYEGEPIMRAYENQRNKHLVRLYPDDFLLQNGYVMTKVHKMSHQKGTIEIKAPAKINLGLFVGAALENGYHEVASAMQSVSLADSVFIRQSYKNKTKRHVGTSLPKKEQKGFEDVLASENRQEVNCRKRETNDWDVDAQDDNGGNGFDIKILSQHEGIPEEKNLAYRAATRLFIEKEFPATEISIYKNIPEGAGLAGGSTDAAAVLVGINRLYKLGFSAEKLEDIGAQLGADVPFCVRGGLALATGRGERLSHYNESNGMLYFSLYTLPIKTSTPAVFKILDELRETSEERIYFDKNQKDYMKMAISRIEALCKALGNSEVSENSVNSTERDSNRDLENVGRRGVRTDYLEKVVSMIPQNDLEAPANIFLSERMDGTMGVKSTALQNEHAKSSFGEVLAGASKDLAQGKNFLENPVELMKQEFLKQGAIYAAMSGSGSTVYGIFSDKKSAVDASKALGAVFAESLTSRVFSD